MRIPEAQKHTDPKDPEHCFFAILFRTFGSLPYSEEFSSSKGNSNNKSSMCNRRHDFCTYCSIKYLIDCSRTLPNRSAKQVTATRKHFESQKECQPPPPKLILRKFYNRPNKMAFKNFFKRKFNALIPTCHLHRTNKAVLTKHAKYQRNLVFMLCTWFGNSA
jgi:hypothetical protein